MSWISGPCVGEAPRGPTADDPVVEAALDYGEASLEQGAAVARGDQDAASAAQRRAMAALGRLLNALPEPS